MSIVLLAATLAAAAPVDPATARSCLPDRATLAASKPKAGAHLLGHEPPANMLLTVRRRVGGCDAPAVVRTGIGSRGGR